MTKHEEDYDDDGNNIVPCPICMDKYCQSKEGGKCPQEDEFVKWIEARNKLEEQDKKWAEKVNADFKGWCSIHSSMIGQLDTYEMNKISDWFCDRIEENNKRIASEVEKMKKYPDDERDGLAIGYNSALSDVLKLLDNTNK